MRAIRYYGPGDVRLDEIPEPHVGEKQVKIKVCPHFVYLAALLLSDATI